MDNLLQNNQTPKEIVKTYQKAVLDQFEINPPLQLYESEKVLFNCVKNGDLEGLEDVFSTMEKAQPPIGTMSQDPLKQAQFTVVSGITLVTRYAMTGGLPDAEAYHLSDAYLQKLNNSLTIDEAMNIFLVAIRDFTKRVNDKKLEGTFSLPVSKALRYINSHLHEKPSLNKIAERCSVTPQYLSTVFHKETGLTVSCYIRREKLKVAAEMLEQSDFSIQRISTLLEFPSQSAFTKQFKDFYGTTPYKYQKEKQR